MTHVLPRARPALAPLLALVLVLTAALGVLAPPAKAAGFGERVLAEAARHAGKPYSYGATGPGSFDCSGFTGYVYGRLGISLPRTSRDQYAATRHVGQAEKQVGDLLFNYNSGGIYHVGIYAGNEMMWAAPKAGDVVRLQRIWTNQYWVGRPVADAITQHWVALGSSASPLGPRTGPEFGVPGGTKADYAAGDIYWSSSDGAHEVHGDIVRRYDQLGGSGSGLGMPVADEQPVPGGAVSTFRSGRLYWSPSAGVHLVRGGIGERYDALAGPAGPLGLPVSDEQWAPGGAVSAFSRGQVLWSAATGAHAVYGGIAARYAELGGPGGRLGMPLSDERDAPGGRESVFQGGTLRWQAATGAVQVLAG